MSSVEDEPLTEFGSISSYQSCDSSLCDNDQCTGVVSVSAVIKQPKSSSLTWRKSVLSDALTKLEPINSPRVVEPKPKCYLVVTDTSVGLIRGGPGDSLVTVFGEHMPNTTKPTIEGWQSWPSLARPVYAFTKTANWKYAARALLKDLTTDGVYLVAISWTLKRPFQLANGAPFAVTKPMILHCVCKEPNSRFVSGRIGPINTFVPHRESESTQSDHHQTRTIGGIWVSLFDDQIYAEFVHQLTPFKSAYRDRLKAVDDSIDQMMFFVANEGVCVGMQVMNTKREERAIRQSKVVYHHERPLILQDGFYLVEGKFEIAFLNHTPNGEARNQSGLELNTAAGPKIVIIGEGTHLIRTVTEPVIRRGKPPTVVEASVKAKTKLKGGRHCLAQTKSKCRQANAYSPVREGSLRSSIAKRSKVKGNKAQTKQPNTAINEACKIRKVEVCLDRRYDRITALDYATIKHDFRFNFGAQ